MSQKAASAVLDKARGVIERGEERTTRHARERMRERKARAEDIRNAIFTATDAKETEPGKWRLKGGVDLDGDSLDVVMAVFDYPPSIITVI